MSIIEETPSGLGVGRRPRLPRTAFCFHDPQPSGASRWLCDFLLSDGFVADRAIAVLPAPSPMEAPLRDAGIEVRVLAGRMGALTDNRGWQDRAAVALNRACMVADYVSLFRGEAVQLVYANSSVQIAPMIAARVARLPLVVHVHEAWNTGCASALKRLAVRRLANAALFAAQSGLDMFGGQPIGRSWMVSPNGVAPELLELSAHRRMLRQRFEFAGKDRVVLFLGTLCERKGVHDLAACWPDIRRRFPAARLVVAGNLDAQERNRAILDFAQAPPEGAEYLGYRDDARELLCAADLFVLPSYGEAMPLSISEAMMIGTPVVARAVGDVEWQIGDGCGFPFRGKGPRPLTEALATALSNPTEAASRAIRARNFAKKYLLRDVQNRQVRRMIRRTAGKMGKMEKAETTGKTGTAGTTESGRPPK